MGEEKEGGRETAWPRTMCRTVCTLLFPKIKMLDRDDHFGEDLTSICVLNKVTTSNPRAGPANTHTLMLTLSRSQHRCYLSLLEAGLLSLDIRTAMN